MCRSAALWTRVVPKIRNGYGQKPAERRAGRSLRRIYVRTEKSTSHPISRAGCASYILCGRDDVGIVPYILGERNAYFFRASSTATATLTAAPPWVSSAQHCESNPATCRWQVATLPMVEREAAASYFFRASSTATATLTVAPTMGLLPMPRKPIISTWAGTEEEPANWASECIRPMVSVMP